MIQSRKTLFLFAAAWFWAFSISSIEAVSIKTEQDQSGLMKVFFYEEDIAGVNAALKGIVVSMGPREDISSNSLMPNVQDKTKVSVRLYDQEGIKPGDTLYVINDKNLVVSKMEVKTIFYTKSFGYMLVGYGDFRFARNRFRVVQKVEEQNSKYAYIFRSRGDYYQVMGDTAESINHYKKALEMDKGNPGAHMELGYIYLKENLLQFAYKEFSEGYKNIGRLYDNEDKFLLLKGLSETRYKEAYYTTLPQKLKEQYIHEGIKYCKEALAINPKSTDINFYIGMFYFRNPESSDTEAKNYMVKVIESDPEKIEPYLVLAELYYNHKNKEKALYYSESALKIDPTNERAKFIRKLSEE